MLFPGNAKLGRHLIWSFSLPSGTAAVCVGMTPTCRRICYAAKLESYRPTTAKRYAINLRLSRRRGFVRRIRAFIIANYVRIVRIHAGGEFFSQRYARKWLAIIRRSPKVRFFTYTRSWRVPAIRGVLEEMAAEPNLQLWYSADRGTGLPDRLPAGVRVAWLMTAQDERPPRPVDLIFRVTPLRRTQITEIDGVPVCPAEDGLPRNHPVTCDLCRTCWRPPPSTIPPLSRRMQSLPLITEASC
jgi:hypothetical protein